MSVLVVGIEHRRAPLPLLEQVAVSDDALAKVLGALRDRPNLIETVVLSTCVRTEVYCVADRFHDAVAEVSGSIAEHAGMTPADLEPYLAVRFDDDVTSHLFSVASGLESAVPGESEVLGQVRRAWQHATAEQASGPVLGGLFRHAVLTGKRVRSETGVGRGTTSFSHAAVELAEARAPGGLAGRRVVVVGAGELGEGVLRALVERVPEDRPGAIAVVNRSPARAASAVGALEAGPDAPPVSVAGLDRLAEALGDADVALVAVEAEDFVVRAEHLAARAAGAPALVVVDLGMPRAVAPVLGERPGVTLLTIDDLRAAVDRALDGRRAELDRAEGIVAEEVRRYREAARGRVAAPVISALRTRLEELRAREVERRRAAGLSAEAAAQVDEATRAVLAKLLHEPTLLLKETAGTPRGERLVEALRILFDL